MYLNFFGLTKAPFHITPDPAFLFPSASHKEAYASVVYGVDQRKGFIVLTGEVGTGKTTVLRSFLSRLDRENCRPIYLFNPEISFEELVRVLLQELGEQARKDASPAYLLHKLYWTLVEEYKQNRNVVLLIDEAQNMPIETMERVRMLSNLETTQDKLLQIVFVGQPELDEKLNRQELRQLRQRIAVRATLRPLSPEESTEYIAHRFEIAGARAASVFSKAAIARLVREANGSPRALNILCDNALIAGFGNDERPISVRLVNDVIRDYKGVRRHNVPRRRLVWAAAAGVLIGAGALLSMLVPGAAAPDAGESALPARARVTADTIDVADMTDTTNTTPATDVARVVDTIVSVDASTTAVVPASAIPSASIAAPVPAPEAARAFEIEPAPEVAPAPELVPASEAAPATELASAPEVHVAPEVARVPASSPEAVAVSIDSSVLAATSKDSDTPAPVAATLEAAPAGSTGDAGAESVPRMYHVQEGEFLTRILAEQYGEVTKSLRDKVLAANPQILDEDVIIVGETLVLPARDAAQRGTLPDGETQ